MPDANLERLIAAARQLRPVLEELVFVGGAVVGLLLTDEAAGQPRPTLDVDAIAEINTYADYSEFGERLRSLGFTEDSSQGAPVCRWINPPTTLDVMPLDEKILGFSNRWYRAALKTATTLTLGGELDVRVCTAPYLMATKLEAFKGRGGRDYVGSRDLEDIVALVDGRSTIVAEIRAEPAELIEFIRGELRTLLAASPFLDALPGFLLPDAASQSRIRIVMDRLEDLASS